MPDTLGHIEPTKPALAAAQWLYADSLAALACAREAGLPPSAEIVTCSPALAETGAARSLEDGVDAARIAALSGVIDKLGADLHDRLRAIPSLGAYALTVARAAPPFEIAAYKAMLIDRCGLDRPFVIAEPENGAAAGAESPLIALLDFQSFRQGIHEFLFIVHQEHLDFHHQPSSVFTLYAGTRLLIRRYAGFFPP